ncbi:MAG: glycosyltransferase family 39 protein [Gemmatimonadetes bacterium]|nr:glycosyltransferase family 39 protein [Gemmatimonadota bacterium]
MDNRIGRSSRLASSSASGPHGHQSTGFSACWSRYGLAASARRLGIRRGGSNRSRRAAPREQRPASGVGQRVSASLHVATTPRVFRYLSTLLDPAGFSHAPNPDAWRQATRIVWIAAAVRLVIGAVVPLFPDEAYYWDWSRNLAPGYFDHPPAIAFAVWLGTAVFGDTAFGVRVVPILLTTGAGVAIIRTARALGGDGAARLAAVCFTVMPIAAAGAVLATPDAPLLFALAWCEYAVIRALGMPEAVWMDPAPGTDDRTRWWMIAGPQRGWRWPRSSPVCCFPSAWPPHSSCTASCRTASANVDRISRS